MFMKIAFKRRVNFIQQCEKNMRNKSYCMPFIHVVVNIVN